MLKTICVEKFTEMQTFSMVSVFEDGQTNSLYSLDSGKKDAVQVFPKRFTMFCCFSLFSGKAFSITYIRLKFQSSRPESFAIYKKTSEDGAWIPYQFYSASCEETYNRQTREIITRDDETMPICTDEYSDISPLTGGSVAFSTLEGRPSAYNFENSPVLQVRYKTFQPSQKGPLDHSASPSIPSHTHLSRNSCYCG